MKIVQLTQEELTELFNFSFKTQFDNFKKDFSTEKANDDLLTRTEACEFLKIDSSTLWAWQNKGKVKGYAIVKRRYYKRSELLDCLIPVIK
jgi:hypothetical protein